MCVLTVSSEMPIRAATSLFALPAATRHCTSRSRVVSSSSAMCSTSSNAMSAAMRRRPAWTLRRVSTRSLRSMLLSS